MLSKLRVQHYKSLFDTEIDLEPLTVFIGPNGSGKSNICESLTVLSNFLQKLIESGKATTTTKDFFLRSLERVSEQVDDIRSKFWHGNLDYLYIGAVARIPGNVDFVQDISINFDYFQETVCLEEGSNAYSDTTKLTHSLWHFLVNRYNYPSTLIGASLKKVGIYDFSPTALSSNTYGSQSDSSMDRAGNGIANALADILLTNRERFDELESRFKELVPNVKRILLLRKANQPFSLELIDKYSEHHISASDISDGTLRILGFLTAIYQENTPSIICFEEIENGIHPWLLYKIIELLKIVSTEGINGNPVQVLITTHSPVLLNYVEPHQVRAVELDAEGKTQVHNLPVDSVRFQKALEAYDGDLGELWFTNVFGGNPE